MARASVPSQHVRVTAAILACCYPLVLVKMLYVTWFVAWAILGHRPRPNLDDPTYISPAVSAVYVSSGLLFAAFPAAYMIGVWAAAWLGSKSRRRALGTIAMGLAMTGIWFATIAFIRWDPWRVMDWYMD